jgi:hypothetical protein
MPFVLTQADAVQCQHGGKITVTAAGATKLKVGGKGVLLESLSLTWVFACPSPTPCTSVLTLQAKTTKLKVQGSAVLFAAVPSIGQASPSGLITAIPSQTKLSAI